MSTATDNFLKELSKDLQPVKPLLSPQHRGLIWIFVSLSAVLGIMLVVQNFRPGFVEQLKTPRFFLETLFSFLSAISLSLCALILAVPGWHISRTKKLLAALPFLLFLGSIVVGYLGAPSLAPSMAGKRPFCFYEVLIFSWFPIAIMVYLVRRAHAHVNRSLVIGIGLASASIPMGLMQMACFYDPEHVLSSHVFAAAIVTAAMGLFGTILLKRKN